MRTVFCASAPTDRGPRASEIMRDRTMSEERLRKLRDGIGDVVEILESVRQRANSFAVRQIEAEKASAKAESKLKYRRTRLAERIGELAGAEGRLEARGRDHDQLYLNWLATNTNLAIIAYFRRLRDHWSRFQPAQKEGP